jgi:hypothetical protein
VRFLQVALGIALLASLSTACSVQNTSEPLCPAAGQNRELTPLVLLAQSVPTAAFVPCIAYFPPGWTFGGEHLRNGRSEFWLDSDRAGYRAVTVVLAPACGTSGAVEVPPEPNEPPMKRFEEPKAVEPSFSGNRYYVFPGGCVTYRFAFVRGATFAQAVEASEALTFVDRALGVRELAKEGLLLCGRGAPPCPG